MRVLLAKTAFAFFLDKHGGFVFFGGCGGRAPANLEAFYISPYPKP